MGLCQMYICLLFADDSFFSLYIKEFFKAIFHFGYVLAPFIGPKVDGAILMGNFFQF